jgi:DivIVA domain-containing protein
MTDSSDSSFAPRGSRTSPEAVAERTFSQAKRGYAESEVRAYLRMVSDELAGAAARERELGNRVRDLESQLQKPSLPPSDQDLVALLGEETARVLGQARESAAELRSKAEEHARRVVREAQETARELRTTTQQAVEAKTREAEDAARARAKEIVGEARAMRERILLDLNERRDALVSQINDLRGGRGQLVETYQIVERALAHATRVIAAEPSAPADAPAPPADGPLDATATADVAVPQVATATESAETVGAADATDSSGATADAPEAAADPHAESDAESAAGPDVGALFEKLRSGTGTGNAAPTTEGTEAPPDSPAGEAPDPADSDTDTDSGDASGDDSEDGSEATLETPPGDGAAAAARDAALAETTGDLVRRGKRALQDEQNDLLDGLRRQRGKIDLTKVLPALDDQLARWAHVLQPSVDAAYAAGALSAGGALGAAPRTLLMELSTSTVTPLRDRLSASIERVDARTPADTEIALAQRLGARYREWRSQDLDTVLTDAVAVAYSRGVYDAAPDGARLRWIPTAEGKCPDCDDNALEPTVKGSVFPTGQPHPPAHPGCRCVLVVEPTE